MEAFFAPRDAKKKKKLFQAPSSSSEYDILVYHESRRDWCRYPNPTRIRKTDDTNGSGRNEISRNR